MPWGQCILCGNERDLQLSHILPAFVFRWLRESSGGAHVRLGANPNQRVQDGHKRHWMCAECEGRLNWSETLFAKELFYPYLKAPSRVFGYSRWLIHFCTSLSWRVLRLYHDEFGLDAGDRYGHLPRRKYGPIYIRETRAFYRPRFHVRTQSQSLARNADPRKRRND